MSLVKMFKKQGGMKLLAQYWKSGAFFTSIGQIVLLGKSNKALEILRLSAHLKAKQKLQKKYYKKLIDFDSTYNDELKHDVGNKVWICWFQGIENAPDLVKVCYNSIVTNLINHEVILITRDNIYEYVEFPDYIIEKWQEGKITDTHMTDLLRLELLIKYGGVWVDATVFCTEREDKIPSYFFESDLFFFQCLKPGRDGHSHINSSWYINAKTNNKLLMACRYLCYEYWRKNNSLIDYFLLHDFMAICLEYYQDMWREIVPRDNATPHILLLRLFDQFNDVIWNSIKSQTPFHKLTYKFTEDKTRIKNTYYDKLIIRDIWDE